MNQDLMELQEFWDKALKSIASNFSNLRDSKNNNRYASGVTAASIGLKNISVMSETEQAIIATLTFPQYVDYIDKGVKGWQNTAKVASNSKYQFKRAGRRIPLNAIRQFMRNRKIVPRNADGKRTPLTNPDKQLNKIAYAIGYSIKKKGIDSVPVISSVLNDKLLTEYGVIIGKMYSKRIVELVVQDLRTLAA